MLNLAKMKAVKKFKTLVERKRKRPSALVESVGRGVRALHPFSSSSEVVTAPPLYSSKGDSVFDLRDDDQAVTSEGVHPTEDVPLSSRTQDMHISHPAPPALDGAAERDLRIDPNTSAKDSGFQSPIPEIIQPEAHDKGHAHDPTDEEPLFLGIGTGGSSDSLETPHQELVAESPTAAEFSIYDTAYQQEVDRIRAAQGAAATVYLTRRVDGKKEYKADKHMIKAPLASELESKAHEGFKNLLDKAREQKPDSFKPDALKPEKIGTTGRSLSDIATKAMENTKSKGRELSDRGNAAFDNALQRAVEKRKERSDRKEAERDG